MFLLVLYCLIAVVFTFLCSIMESVFLSITPSFVNSFSKKNPKVGTYLKWLKNNVDDAEGAILVLNTFATTAAATGVGIEVASIFGLSYQALGATLLTIVLIYFSEILPKTIGATYWRSLALYVTLGIYYLLKIVRPFVIVAKLITHFVKTSGDLLIGRDEILTASEMGKKSGSISKNEEDLIKNLLNLKNYEVIDILTPRSVVVALPYNCSVKEALKKEGLHNHSNILVYMDHPDTVIGIVQTTKILKTAKSNKDKKIATLMKPAYIVPTNLNVLNLLNLFILKQERLFIVQDRYAQFAGVVTLEDAIETLLGKEIIDEFDEAVDLQKLAKEKLSKRNLNFLNKIRKI